MSATSEGANTPDLCNGRSRLHLLRSMRFGEQLQGEFPIPPLLPRTNRQVSEGRKFVLIPFQRHLKCKFIDII